MSHPVICVGMPIYNAERYLHRALDALLGQSFHDFELIISDNASTDGSEAICREYAARDARIRYLRQPINLGATANFRFVLEQARSEYFMWAAADDIRSPDFLETNYQFLKTNSDFLASTSPVRFAGGQFNPEKMGDATLDHPDPNQRVIQPFSAWHANGRFYSLFRRQPLTEWPHLQNFEFLGSDWTLITHLATLGKFHRSNIGWVELGTKGMSNTTDIFKTFRKRKLHWFVPFHDVTKDAFAHLHKPKLLQRLVLFSRLLRLNRKAAKKQFKAWRKARR